MSLPVPNLDDRSFDQLVADAKLRLKQACPTWTDLSPHDPGIVLLEVFAYLTEVLIYRLNRVPEKVYVEFLHLIGVRLQPPSAARVRLVFSRQAANDQAVEIGRGTRVTTARPTSAADAPVFIVADTVRIEPKATQAEVLAYQCELVDAELAGVATGLPGHSVQAARPPIIAPTGDSLDLVVAVEALPTELDGAMSAREYRGKMYAVWCEVETFADSTPDAAVFVADRNSGLIVFAPALRLGGSSSSPPVALARVPAAGREIRLWYRRGGGPGGNVGAQVLTVLKDPIPGLDVTNPVPATGGSAAETLENAKLRGPQELHSLKRAVTARDFELVALRSSGAVARAKAFTQASLWKHASPGTVEVVLVPNLPDDARGAGQVTAAALEAYQKKMDSAPIQATLDERRPLGTSCVVNWAHYKSVRVKARIVAHRAEDADALEQRILKRLYETITPLATTLLPSGWPFGHPLRAAQVYDLLTEPGVADIEQFRLVVAEVPDSDVTCVAVDAVQSEGPVGGGATFPVGRTQSALQPIWYVASGAVLFRSQDKGEGWEAAGRFTGEAIRLVAVHPICPGLLAASTVVDEGTRLHISRDSGETWETARQLALSITDLAWTVREGTPVLFIAAEPQPGKQGGGLFELVLRPEAAIQQVLVDPNDQNRALYAVAASTSLRGEVSVAVAMQSKGGVFLSSAGGAPGTFRAIGLDGRDVQVLAVQQYGNRSFLWAGIAADPGEPGTGCWRWEISSPEDWKRYDANWANLKGGSCRWLAFAGTKVIAATHRAGVLWIADTSTPDAPPWEAPTTSCGLPLRVEEGRPFQPVASVATNPDGSVILAGVLPPTPTATTDKGIYRSTDGGKTYARSSKHEFSEFSDKVTLPATWLFCSEKHDIEVVSEDEAGGN